MGEPRGPYGSRGSSFHAIDHLLKKAIMILEITVFAVVCALLVIGIRRATAAAVREIRAAEESNHA